MSDLVGELLRSPVGEMSFGEAVGLLMEGAESSWGPWSPDRESWIVSAYGAAEARAGIAEGLIARFGPALESAMMPDRQQWWLSATDHLEKVVGSGGGSVFSADRGVYCCGEFTWDSVWTVSEPPDQVHDDLIDVWELFPGPISRWLVPVRAGARVYEVRRPSDWARLVACYPTYPGAIHQNEDLPGPNVDPSRAARLEASSRGAASRRHVEVAMPDWKRVAADIDGVHLSWAGTATCEGRVIDVDGLGPGVVSTVRYWGSERTLWLSDVFDTHAINRALGRTAIGA